MRASQFLFEYSRNITAKQVGDQLLMALKNDDGTLLNDNLDAINFQLGKEVKTINDLQKYPETTRNEWKIHILAAIEQLDPTPAKKYVPWLARMYAKAGGGLRMEDINRMNLVGLYDLAKLKKKLKPEHKDINSFKWYTDFEDTAENEYNYFRDLTDDEVNEGSATKLFENEDVLVLTPNDEAAACKYGRNTRWCTAATKGYNYFDSYNKRGPLYILIPKNPKYDNEKYQLHFATNSYMDEEDDPIDMPALLTKRFPGLIDFFAKIEPGIQYSMGFIYADDAEKLFDMVKKSIKGIVEELREQEKYKDTEYHKFLEYEGYIDEQGEIDWDRVEDSEYTYEKFNPSFDKVLSFINRTLHPGRMWEEEEYEPMKDIRRLPYYMADDLFWIVHRNKELSYGLAYDSLDKIRTELSTRQLLKTSDGKWRITK